MDKTISIDIITHSEDLPDIRYGNFFHSQELFRIIEQTPGESPYMVVASKDGKHIGHMLAMLRRRGALMPPYLFTQGRVYGCGEYAEGEPAEEIFGLMLSAITRKFRNKLCLYIKFSNLRHKMFGYKMFRDNGYFPVRLMEVHNSLHSKSPEERLTPKTAKRIRESEKDGVETSIVENTEELEAFHRMFKRFFSLKIHRYIPNEGQFCEMSKSNDCHFIITKYKNKIIGGCVCVHTEGNAYLWYLASKRKTYRTLHPGTMTVWAAIKHAYKAGCDHIYFMDVGLPFKRTPYRDFILRFGGKPVGTYRWYRCSLPWINKFLNWIYRE